jgi:hypothetical protein
VFFDNTLGNLMVTGLVQNAAANSSVDDPMFKSLGTKPAPWYFIGNRASPAYESATDGSHRGAYQQSAAPAGTFLILR